MSTLQLALLAGLLVFLAMALLVIGIGRWFVALSQKERLQQAVMPSAQTLTQKQDERRHPVATQKIQAILDSLSRLSMPKDGWQTDEVRLKFVQAGFLGDSVARKYYTVKSLLTVIVPALLGIVLYYGYNYRSLLNLAFVVFSASAAGFYIPDLILRARTNARIEKMRETLPDLIDLLVICTESGLALDQAINRVSHEIGRSSRMVAEEFHMVTLEIRAGADRPSALRNLALRVKLDDLSNFASMLIQADKFGTSIAEALRIQSEVMRVRRMQRAEEQAAKIPTKMLLPLVLCIFPVLMIVMLGPAVIQLFSAIQTLL